MELLYLVGFVVNELYEEPHTFQENYPVQINLVDGLNLLERTIRGSVGNTTGLWNASEKATLQNIIFQMLADTGLELDLVVQSGLFPKQAIDDGLTANSPLLYQSIEPQVWQTDDGYHDDKWILEDILKSQTSSIFQKNNRWYIINSADINRSAEDFTVSYINGYIYSFSSQYETKTGEITADEVLNTNFWIGQDTTKTIKKGIEAQNIELDWIQRPNFVINGDYEDGFSGMGAQ